MALIEQPPFPINEREWDGGLWLMVLASGGLHVLAVALLLLLPHSFAHHPPAMLSYTVDLVAPDKVGGTNVVAGGKGRVQGPPLTAAGPAPSVEPPKPVPPKVEEVKAPEPKPEPQKPAAEKPAVAVVAKPEPVKPEPVKTEAKLEAPKTKPREEKKPAEKDVAAAEKVKKAEHAKAPPKVDAEAAKKAAAEAAARERDARILAAVKRAEQQLGERGGGTGQTASARPGGPISVGPGEGAGGQVMGLEYMLYYNALINRLKQSWAWAGANRSLETVVRFSITDTGDIINIRITHPSGDPSYDASVERAVKAINPLPPPPEGYRKQFSDVEITFSPESLQM
jgi:TonB family protein